MKTANKLINLAYCIGAAIVVFGAWAKIEHKSFSNFFLTLGLLTEVVIFVIYGMMEWFGPASPREIELNNDMRGIVDTEKLTSAVKETNSILKSVFKVQ